MRNILIARAAERTVKRTEKFTVKKRFDHDGPDYLKLQKMLCDSPGFKIYAQMRILDASYYVFEKNHSELAQALAIFGNENTVMVLWAESNRDKLHTFQIEVIRLLHNFLASVKSLVEHTRIVLVQNLYKGHVFETELKARTKQQFNDSELSHFVQDLRNYILHRGLPMTSANLQWKSDGPINSSIQLDVVELRKWDRWSMPSRKYLEPLSDKIRLDEVVRSYAALAYEFHSWVKKRQEDIHRTEFEEMRALNAEYEKAQNDFFGKGV